ncbi:MAG: DUF1109 domain-containing protein [Burkholderiales bacterium]|nr:DUF1109 domain-containing protein [Burkholderiales bacterium]
MKTDDLVAMLAASAEPVVPRATARRYGAALGWGAFGSLLIMALLLGVRPDLGQAAQLPMFWIKLAFPLSLAAAALAASTRLSRPGVRLGGVPLALALPVLAIWAMAVWTLAGAAPDARADLVLGSTWRLCPIFVAVVSIPSFIAAMWAMRGLAPTRLALAGAAAGLLAGAIGAAIYALHCDEMQAPFLAVWYVLGMLVPTASGALLGPRLLRW